MEVSAGLEHTCGVTTSGAAYCWGSNLFGELGTGVTTGPEQCRSGPVSLSQPRACAPSPVAVAGGLRFNAVSAGYAYTCGVTTNGAAYCWGDTYGAAPVPVASGLTFTAVSAGSGSGGRYTCGLTTGGAVYCWYAEQAAAPVAVGGGLSFAAASIGNSDDHACGITVAGVAYCWGNGVYGQLGVGTQTGSSVPVKVAYQP